MGMFAWFFLILGFYLVIVAWNGWRGRKKSAESLEGYAIGRGSVRTSDVAWSVTTAVTSPVTFLGIAGFAYVSGLSSLWWMVITPTAFAAALYLVGPRYKWAAHSIGALSLPHWMGYRYQSQVMRVLVSLLYLLNVFYLVGVWSGLSLAVGYVVGIPYQVALIANALVLTFYVLVGGNYAVIKSDVVQGYLMMAACIAIVVGGFFLFDGFADISTRLSGQSANFVRIFNPDFSIFSGPVAIVGLCVFWLMYTTLPHVNSRALVLNRERDYRKYVVISFLITFVFASSVIGGIYARALGVEVAAPDIAGLAVVGRLPDVLGGLVYVAITAAALSTVSVMILTIGTIAGNDLYKLTVSRMKETEQEDEDDDAPGVDQGAKTAGRVVILVAVALSVIISLNPPGFISIFSTIGLYGFLAGVCGPLILGLYWQKASTAGAITTVILGPICHLALYYSGVVPSVFATGAVATVFGFLVMYVASLLTPRKVPWQVVETMWETPTAEKY